MRFRRGDVLIASLDPTVGSEQGKTRPVLVIQNDIDNQHSPVVIVAAITSAESRRAYPTEVLVEPPEGGLARTSRVLLNQLRTLDKRRFGRTLGALSPETMAKVDEALKISLGLVPLE